MIKALLKRIFPPVILKNAFQVYNSVKIATIDKFLFPEKRIPFEQFKLYRTGYPFIENNVTLESIINVRVRAYMEQWKKWTQEEFILVFTERHVIEPFHGWAIYGPNKLIYYSLGISRTLFLAKPSIIKWFFKKKNIKNHSKLISLRDTGEENYFHFYNDVLSKLYFLEANGFNLAEYKILISSKLWSKAYFQYWLVQNHSFGKLDWLVQNDDEYIACTESVFCKPLTHKPLILTKIFESYYKKDADGDLINIYLKRNPKRLRFIENSNEIEALVKKYNYTIIDTDDLSPEQQANLFRKANKIIGIHGAGLTNIMFTEKLHSLIELFPPTDSGYLPFHYIMIASIKFVKYNAIIGTQSKQKFGGGFEVSVEELEKVIIKGM